LIKKAIKLTKTEEFSIPEIYKLPEANDYFSWNHNWFKIIQAAKNSRKT
jgi:hypothetical protein